MTVHAPFRFSPINRWVYFPDWAEAVSHDIPFADGLSGEIHFEAEVIEPLLVGGPRRKATKEAAGEVRPFQLPDGRYAIPGSSWQGMIRQILEIAAFGKLGERILERRFGLQPLSTHDLLRNSTCDHFCERDDFPALIFGSVANDARGLKRRAVFDMTLASLPPGVVPLQTSNETVLASPKPSYAPLYVRQPVGTTLGNLPPNQPYATYDHYARAPEEQRKGLLEAQRRPELMGAKVWPAVKGGSSFPTLPRGEDASKATQIKLCALPKKTTFKEGRVRFHNLREVELGALIWAMTLGDKCKVSSAADQDRHAEPLHRLGMGKPFQMGAISIRITGLTPAPAFAAVNLGGLLSRAMDAFTRLMIEVYRDNSGAGGPWSESVQVATLIKAAYCSKNSDEYAFSYMSFSVDRSADAFRSAKKVGDFLPPYVTGKNEPPRRTCAGRDGADVRGADDPVDKPAPAQRHDDVVSPSLAPIMGATIFLSGREMTGVIISSDTGKKGRWLIRLENGEESWIDPKSFTVTANPAT